MDFHKVSSYLVTASDDESIRLYDVANATCLKTINSKKYGVDLVCFTSHPITVIYSSKNGWDESLRLLSLNDNKYLRYFKGQHDRVVSLSLCARNDSFISCSLDRTVMLWDQRAEKCQFLNDGAAVLIMSKLTVYCYSYWALKVVGSSNSEISS